MRPRQYKRPGYQRLTTEEQACEPSVLVDPTLYVDHYVELYLVRGRRLPTPSCIGAYCVLDR